MANYMKSEFYRILHDKTIYLFTLVLAGFAAAYNVISYLFLVRTPDFQYGTVRFAFIQLITSMGVFYFGAWMIVMFLSTDEYKHGVQKNAVACGISRSSIFIGKCIVYGVTAASSAAVILAVFISTAYGLLQWEPAVPMDAAIPLRILLVGAAANVPFSLASVVLAVALLQIFQRENIVYIGWLSVVCAIPAVFRVLGYKIPLYARIAGWMPWNFLSMEVYASFSSPRMDALWMHPEGLLKLMIVGAVGIALFGAVGITGFRKKDIS